MSSDEISMQSHDGDDDLCFEAFRKEMQLKDEAKRLKAEEQLRLKKMQRFSKRKQWRQQVKRTQQYLGLFIPTAGSMEVVSSGLENLTVTARSTKENPGLSVPNDFSPFIVFISIDIEAFEFNQRLITEIGISTLDTVDLLGLLPGVKGNNWAAKIRSRHFRILEHSHRLNKVHVEGCPDKFHFGHSEWIYERDVISALKECFNPSQSPFTTYSSKIRKVVLVAHDVAADMKYLTQLGFDVTQMVSDHIDTSDLYKAAHRDARQSALSTLLLCYGIAGKHLHNAGNDASYTLRVMIAIALDDFQNRKTAEEWEIEKHNRIKAACEEARAKVCTEFEGWSTSDDEDITDSSTLPLIVDQQQEKKAPGNSKGRSGSDAKPIMKYANRLRRDRPAYRTNIEGALGEVAVQDNPIFQDVSQEPFVPFCMASPKGQSSKRHDGGHDECRSRGRGRGRGRGQGPTKSDRILQGDALRLTSPSDHPEDMTRERRHN